MKKRIVAMLVAAVLCMGVTGALAAYGTCGLATWTRTATACDNAGCDNAGGGRIVRHGPRRWARTARQGAVWARGYNETGKRDAVCAASRRSTGPWSGTPIRFAGCA